MNLRILRALLAKEICLLKRNPFIPKIIFIMPVMVMLVLPLVATFDVKNVTVAVVDNDCGQLSRRLVADMDASDELEVVWLGRTFSDALRLVEQGKADVVLSIPSDFEQSQAEPLEIEANGVNAIMGMLGSQYVAGSVENTLRQWSLQSGTPMPRQAVSVIDRFNPTLDFRNFMIPALIVVLLIIICGFIPALSLVDEKETGTIEAMNVTPVGRFTFVLSKLIPFWLVGMLVVSVGMLIGRLVYGLVPMGSLWTIFLASILFSLVMSGIGVTIANKSSTMLQSIFVMFALIIVFQLMGGLFTPVSSMPGWAQKFTYVVPPRYFNEIIRAVYLKGSSVAELWQPYTCLAAIAAAVCVLAAVTYRKRE